MAALLDVSHISGSPVRPTVDLSGLLHLTADQTYYNLRLKKFSDNFGVVMVCNRPLFNPLKVCDGSGDAATPFYGKVYKPRRRTADAQTDRQDSIKRSRDKVFELAYANKFTHFVTLTLDESKIDRTNVDEIKNALTNWTHNMCKRYQFKYVLIPEYHKRVEDNGKHAIHFHGLVSGNLRLTDSGKKDGEKVIYNLDNWKYGFSTAIQLDENYDRAVAYVLKYITKGNARILGKRYLSGGKLVRSVPTHYDNAPYEFFAADREYKIEGLNTAFKYKTYNSALDNIDMMCYADIVQSISLNVAQNLAK